MLCSVIIACYNSEKYIEHAINSVLGQSIKDLEIIVCDDASTDASVMKIQQLMKGNPQIKLIRSPANRGPSHSRNQAMKHSCGEWLAVLDADDFYHPERIETLIELGKRQNGDIVADNIFITPDDGSKSKTAFNTPSSQNGFQIFSTENFIRRDLPGREGLKFGYLKPVIKRNFLIENNLRYDEEIRLGEDFVFLIHSLIKGAKFIFCHKPLYYYRQSPDSLTRTNSSTGNSILRQNNRSLIEFALRHKKADVVKLLQYREKLYDYYATYGTMMKELKSGNIPLKIGPIGKEISFWVFAIRLFFCRLALRFRLL